jgi:rhamnosyltransferase subunit B
MASLRRRIVLTTFGSLGDLHPYVAIALALKQRGHDAVIATSAFYRARVESLGLGFAPVRPDHPGPEFMTDFMRQVMDLRTGPEFVIRKLIMPALRESYEDTLAAAAGADLLVSHPLTFTTRLVAEQGAIPWASSVLAPLSFFSAYDPPVLGPVPWLARLKFGAAFHRSLFRLARWSLRRWSEPWHRLRAELGLPTTCDDPLFEGQHAPRLTLALFSAHLAAPQPDWPSTTVVTGFPFYDEAGAAPMPPDLRDFLAAGPPPLVFTLGSSAVMDAGAFYEHSAAAAQLLGRRAVLLIGKDPRNRPAHLPDGVAAFDYAPFAELFPHAAAIVHQGGIGTTAQALRSGRPMLIMPYSHDQPDNADRVRRLGVGRVVRRARYTATCAAAELRALLEDTTYHQCAASVATQIRGESGAAAACTALESVGLG